MSILREVKNIKTDFIVVGAGIYGSIISSKLAKLGHKICLLEKENQNHMSNSRLNSGVLHSGVYYPPNSLKRQVCMEGSELMKKFCLENDIKVSMSGKLIVPINKREEEIVVNLYNNFKDNSELISSEQALKYHNVNLRTDYKSLYIKNAGFTDPNNVYLCLMKKIKEQEDKIDLMYNTEIKSIEQYDKNRDSKVIVTTNRNTLIEGKHLINCAGNGSLNIAQMCGIAKNYANASLKAIYTTINQPNIKMLIYPCPLNYALGTHVTPITGDGIIKLGPSVDFPKLFIPKLLFQTKKSINNDYYKKIISDYKQGFFLFGLCKLAFICKDIPISKIKFFSGKKYLTRTILINLSTGRIENDFMIENKENTTHLLNIQSPGWTSSFALCEKVISNLNI